MLCAHVQWLMVASVILFGLGYANLFSIIFSLAIKHVPARAHEVSSLLVTGIAGGAIVTPLLGIVTEATGTQTAAFVAMLVIWVYMCLIFGKVSKTANESA